MKWFVFVLSALIFRTASAQTEPQFVISASGKTVNISLSDDWSQDNAQTISLSSVNHSNFIIQVKNESTKEWKRSFFLDDANESTVLEFIPMKAEGSFCIKHEDLQKTLQKDAVYKLYTVAIPADKEKAMVVRVAKRLVAKVELN